MSNSPCDECRPPRDNKGRFVKRPEPPRYPNNGDRVEIHQYTAKDPYNGFATVIEDRWDEEISTGVMLVETDSGERREIHVGYMSVVVSEQAVTA